MAIGRTKRAGALALGLYAACWSGGCSSAGGTGAIGAGGAGTDAAAGSTGAGGADASVGDSSAAGAGGAFSTGGVGGASAGAGGTADADLDAQTEAGAAGTAGQAGEAGGNGGTAGRDAGRDGAAGQTDDGGMDADANSAGASGAADAGKDTQVEDGAGQAGSDGGTDAAVCVPDSYDCSGDDLRRCASDGSSFQVVETCKAGHCSATAGKCLDCLDPSECPAPAECNQATCVAGACGSAPLTQGTPCSNGGVCNGQGACGCVPGAARCSGNVAETCDTSGVWQTESCSGQTPDCYDGQCEPPTPASCASLAESCGPNATYCCASRLVSGGTFSRSYDGALFTNASYTATISDFRLDAYEVTVGRFREFVNAGQGTQATAPAAGAGANPAIAGSGWNSSWNGNLVADSTTLRADLHCSSSYATWTDAPAGNESRPINCVTWYEAFAFCAWDGGRLPTEAEWNYAAAGGDEQRVYPWSVPPDSNAIDPSLASYWVDGTQQCMGDGTPGCALTDLVPVGSKPGGAGRWGQFDLAGNVWEWTLDTYENPYSENPCNDCADLSGGSNRVIRGGAFYANQAAAFASTRSPATATSRYYTVGLRCAR